MIVIGLVGNPNCGKSALFNSLTGIRQTTGNWPGVTVEKKEGFFSERGKQYTVVDLPGVYSLDTQSLDEKVTKEFLLSKKVDLIVNVVDASNLERNLYLSVQLQEFGIPSIVALNMVDVAAKRGIEVDCDVLSSELNSPVIPVVAVKNQGLGELKKAIHTMEQRQLENPPSLTLEPFIESAIDSLLSLSKENQMSRYQAMSIIESDIVDELPFDVDKQIILKLIENVRRECIELSGEDFESYIADVRFGYAHKMSQKAMCDKSYGQKTLTDRIDRWVLNRWLGIPIFMFVMYLMFMFTINVGGAFIDFFDIAVGAILIEWPLDLMAEIGVPDYIAVILAKGVGGGVQVVSTFIPVIAFLYLFLSFLEDSGYMARAAFVMDKAMQKIGLPGKAFVPMIVGFGCNVPAVMATRTLENDRERKLTILMNPFMSCGARLPVYVLFAAAFFPDNGQNLVFALYLVGIAVAVLTGLIMRKSLLKGDSSGFLMELPTYHIPTLKGVLLRTWDRVKIFIRDAGKVIVLMVLVLNILNSIGQDGSFGNEDSEGSVLSLVGKTFTPIFAPMGIEDDNWPATVGIFTGVMAKEAVVGTLDALYGNLVEGARDIGDDFSLNNRLEEAILSVRNNFSELGGSILDPLGLSVSEGKTFDQAATEQEVSQGTFSEMVKRFNGQAGAVAYLLFILLYFPCVATIGAIVRETGKAWATFVAVWTSGLAYVIASVFYQLSRIDQTPLVSSIWCATFASVMIVALWLLRRWGDREEGIQGHFFAVRGAQ